MNEVLFIICWCHYFHLLAVTRIVAASNNIGETVIKDLQSKVVLSTEGATHVIPRCTLLKIYSSLNIAPNQQAMDHRVEDQR